MDAHEGSVQTKSGFAKEQSILQHESGKPDAETAPKPISGQRRLFEQIKKRGLLKAQQQADSQTEANRTTGGECIDERHADDQVEAETGSERDDKEVVRSSQPHLWQRRLQKKMKQLELLKQQQSDHQKGGDDGKEELRMIRCGVASELGVLVHGRFSPDPIDTIEKAKFFPSVVAALKKYFVRRVFRLQAIAWPHIVEGNSLVCVSSPRTGKTYAILPAICSRVMGLLMNGCALLVTTAPAYKAIYDASPSVFMRARVRVIAIDNFDRMHVACSSELEACRKHWEDPTLQMVVTSTSWHPQLATFLGRNKNTIICIGSYMEAALYAKVNFQVEMKRDSDEKVRALVQFIQEHDYRSQRTIVLTRNAVNIERMVKALQQHAIDFIVCSDSDSIAQNDGLQDWDDRTPGNIPLLICLDDLLGEIQVSKAQHIVHYSMPSSWKMFTKRFVASFDFYEPPKNKPEEPTNRPSSLVLLDEIDNDLLVNLADLLQRYSVACPDELTMLAQTIRNKNATEGRGPALCPQLLALGACRRYRMCYDRHVPVEHDLQHQLPTRGIVLLRVIKTISPVHFRCWISDSDPNGDFSRFTDETNILQCNPAFGDSADLSIDVRIAGVVPSNNDEDWNKYSMEHAQQLIKDYSDKDHCYIYGNVLLTLRDMIWIDELFLVEDTKSEERSLVTTEFTASLISKKYGKRNMKSFELVKQFIQQCKAEVKEASEPGSPIAVDTDIPSEERIGGAVSLPPDSPPEPETVEPVLSEPIVSSLPPEPLAENANKRSIPIQLGDFSVKKTEEEMARFRSDLMNRDSVSLAGSFEELVPSPEHEEYSYERLEIGETYEVGLTAYNAPDNFYIYLVERDVEVGAYCLALEGKTFVRGEINEIRNGAIFVFLLDYGDMIICPHESIFEIPTHLLRLFPFAAIEATFAYIVPTEGEHWTVEKSLEIYDIVLEKHNSTLINMDAYVCGTLAPRRDYGPAHQQYKVILTTCNSSEMFQIIGELLAYDLVLFDHEAFQQDCAFDSDDEGEYVERFAKKKSRASVKELRPEKSHTLSELPKPSTAEKKSPPAPSVVVNDVYLQPRQRSFRYPSTQWDQDDHGVTLYVSAPDVSNHEFVVSTDFVQLRFVCSNELYMLQLHLFGAIDAAQAKYAIRGLTIVVRLPKLGNANLPWPALVNHSNKLIWLKKALARNSDSESESSSEPDDWTKIPLVEPDEDTSSLDSQEDGVELED
ncbi:hypothetical protein ZHAS_00005105 [Anopheles sinensis]|uniref:RNA helicase n=1 Tax=Anopheles sinensis TaxID=74873 RepID=A0A084VIQ6_ANOSI|nr:hypothetical protein ZHAS_00005105 [Anopheles sinensis]